METLRVGIIGCGRPRSVDGATGFGMSHFHAQGYKSSPDADIVALADINLDNARAFKAYHGGDTLYQDYQEMLSRERLDIVSICTWPHLHAPMVVAAAQAGVRAIHCEKPMAPSYGEAVAMVRVCEEHGVQLTFNHQRRFLPLFRKARELLRSGAIGELLRLEATCDNLFDWGTHWFDMMFFYNDETPAAWVIGQVEPRGSKPIFNVPTETQGLSHVKFQNGVHGLMVTGFEAGWEAQNRLVGSEGVIEVAPNGEKSLRMWARGQKTWQNVEVDAGKNDLDISEDAIFDLIAALKTGREPELSGRRALRATELIFATYESSRRRGRVSLPLDVEDSPLEALLKEIKEAAYPEPGSG